MATTPVLKINKMDQAPAVPETVVNQIVQEIETRTIRVLSRTTTAEPGAPADGDAYILPSGTLTGTNWSGYSAGQIAAYIGSAWAAVTPAEGWRVWVNDRDDIMTHDGTAWVPTLIGSDITTTVASSGADFTTIQSALDYYETADIVATATVTIQIADGTYTENILPTHRDGNKFTLKGENTYATTITSVSSTSGSAGNYTVVLNVASVSNIAVNDYVLITNASGGTNPEDVEGCWKVTAVGASTIDVNCTSRYSSAPSGAITGNITTLKTKLTVSSGNCIELDGTCIGNIEDLVIHDATDGIRVKHNSSVIGTSNLGINGCANGVYAWNGGYANVAQVAISNCTDGINIRLSTVNANSAILTGNSTEGVYCAGGHVDITSSHSAGNTTNYRASFGGLVFSGGAPTCAGATTGFLADRAGIIAVPSATTARNTTDYTPAINTEGSQGEWNIN